MGQTRVMYFFPTINIPKINKWRCSTTAVHSEKVGVGKFFIFFRLSPSHLLDKFSNSSSSVAFHSANSPNRIRSGSILSTCMYCPSLLSIFSYIVFHWKSVNELFFLFFIVDHHINKYINWNYSRFFCSIHSYLLFDALLSMSNKSSC